MTMPVERGRPLLSAELKRILVVDDEESLCSYLSVVLTKAGYHVDTTQHPHEALEMAAAEPYAVVLQDLCMPEATGVGFRERLGRGAPGTVSVLLTAYSCWDSAFTAMRLGAFNNIRKPFDNDEIRQIVARAVLALGTDNPSGRPETIIGNTPEIRRVQTLIDRVGRTDSTVLILGESGTGKELVARGLHRQSPRSSAKFVAVNCAGFNEALLESELFGHVKGAFTGATADKKGLFEEAGGGTFFLDEVGEMPVATQAKLLRALEERAIKPVGSVETRPVDVRVIAATNRDLKAEVEAGHFREDLYYRLNVIPIELPPLRQRVADLPLLVGHLISRNARLMDSPVKDISREAMDYLMAYTWPGNIRELDNVLQRATAMCRGERIEREDIDLADGSAAEDEQPVVAGRLVPGGFPDDGLDLEATLTQIERDLILQALQKSSGSLKDTAQLLKMNYRQLRYRVEKLGLRKSG